MSDARKQEQLSLPFGSADLPTVRVGDAGPGNTANSTGSDSEAAVAGISCTGKQVCKAHPATSWEEVRVEDLGEIVSGGTPSRANPDYWNGSIPWVTPSEITELKGKYLYKTRERITEEGLASSAAKLLPPSSVVVSSRATLGEAAIAGVPLTTNQGFKSIIPNGGTDPVFAYYLLRSLKPEMVRLASGTTFLEISKSDFANIRVRRPKREEQSRVAAVLDTVDEAVAKTEAVIGKLRQVRAGLLHNLLTRGLDDHGHLRDPITHPEQFQDSPFGRIPREWCLEPLGARLQQNAGTIQTGPFGSQLHAHEYTTEGVPVIMPQDIREGCFDDTQIVRIPIAKAEELRRHRVRWGDLIFARRGDLSRCAAVTEREVGWLCGTGCLLMRFEQVNLSSTWLSLAYRHDFGQRQIGARAVGTTMVNLNTTLLAYLEFAFPPKEEQETVVHRVSQVDALIQRESTNLSKLGHFKAGLMTDLLTGRVRVSEDAVIQANCI